VRSSLTGFMPGVKGNLPWTCSPKARGDAGLGDAFGRDLHVKILRLYGAGHLVLEARDDLARETEARRTTPEASPE